MSISTETLESRFEQLATLKDGDDFIRGVVHTGLCALQQDVVKSMWLQNSNRERLVTLYSGIIELCGELSVDMS